MRIEVYILCNRYPMIQRTATARWIVAAYDGDNLSPVLIWKRDGVVVSSRSTNKRASVVALRDALKRFTKPAIINLYIEDPFVRHMMQTNMPHRWSINRWTKYRYGQDIKYVEIWKEIYALMKGHAIRYVSADQLYGQQLIKQMEVK